MTPRWSRPCYDKYHRCPRWAGPGLRYAKVQRCPGGSIGGANGWTERRFPKWRVNRCDRCNVRVLPYNVRWIDPAWWKVEWKDIPNRLSDWWMLRRYKHG